MKNKDSNTDSKAEKSACFTGHRDLSESEKSLSERLYALLEKLVEHATNHCICYHDPSRKSGTSQTIGFAKKKGLKVINLFK